MENSESVRDGSFPKLIFDFPFDEVDEVEANARGYLSHVKVELEDGKQVPVIFWSPVRARQDLHTMFDYDGTVFLAEPGMILLIKVTRENMEKAVKRLNQLKYFDAFKDARQQS